MTHRRFVSVFGSARVVPGDREYDEAVEVGRVIAEAGLGVATGGYTGVMEAACRGAAKAGGHTIGATVEEWRGRTPNEWVREVRSGDDLFDRLRILVAEPVAMVAVAGGVGTLAEVALGWNLMQRASRVGDPLRPLVLMGPRWREMSVIFEDQLIDGPGDRDLVTLVDDPEGVATHLNGRLEEVSRVDPDRQQRRRLRSVSR